MSFDRRALLGGLSALGLSAGLAPGLADAATPNPTLPTTPTASRPRRLRKPISSLTRRDPDLAAYRTAIPLMKASGYWDAQIALHADMSHRHHGSWRFLPWHRLQLVWFERQIARLSGKADFSMPYWDWDDDRVPDVFYDDPVFLAPGREAGRGESIRGFLSSTGQRFTGRITDNFATFFGRPRAGAIQASRYYSGSCEWSGHNMIHGFVGGDMGRLDRSPNDPLFWMHHANIDRIWSVWNARQSAGVYPQAWRNEQLDGYVDTLGRPVPPALASSTLDTATFGYAYPVDTTPPVVFLAAPGAPVRRVKDYAWAMKRIDAFTGVIDISAAAAAGLSATAIGYVEATPDPTATSVVTLVATARNGGRELFRDTVYMVGMGHVMGSQGHRITLDPIWGAANTGGIRLTATAAPLAGRRSGETPAYLDTFIVDARVSFAG
jgi:hypothetical protein